VSASVSISTTGWLLTTPGHNNATLDVDPVDLLREERRARSEPSSDCYGPEPRP
jgi:hypothetical protein